jgi:hypothetical protein
MSIKVSNLTRGDASSLGIKFAMSYKQRCSNKLLNFENIYNNEKERTDYCAAPHWVFYAPAMAPFC